MDLQAFQDSILEKENTFALFFESWWEFRCSHNTFSSLSTRLYESFSEVYLVKSL